MGVARHPPPEIRTWGRGWQEEARHSKWEIKGGRAAKQAGRTRYSLVSTPPPPLLSKGQNKQEGTGNGAKAGRTMAVGKQGQGQGQVRVNGQKGWGGIHKEGGMKKKKPAGRGMEQITRVGNGGAGGQSARHNWGISQTPNGRAEGHRHVQAVCPAGQGTAMGEAGR